MKGMASRMSSKWNVKVQGNAQFNEGDGVQNNTGGASVEPATVQSFFAELAKAMPKDENQDTQLAHQALNNVELMAVAMPEAPVTEEAKSGMMAVLTPYFEKLKPYVPTLTKALLGFGDGFFTTLESKNPVVAGLIQMIRAVR